MYLRLRLRCPIFFLIFNQIWIFSKDFRESPISNCTEIRPAEAALIHADKQTDGETEENEANGRFFFCGYANVPKSTDSVFMTQSCKCRKT
jgi:hypothetical protein